MYNIVTTNRPRPLGTNAVSLMSHPVGCLSPPVAAQCPVLEQGDGSAIGIEYFS